MEALRIQDDPWRRLPWQAPLAMLLTFLSLMGFLRLLEQTPDRRSAPRLVDVRVVEVPSTGRAASAPSAVPATPPRPRRVPPPPAQTREVPRKVEQEVAVKPPPEPSPASEAGPSVSSSVTVPETVAPSGSAGPQTGATVPAQAPTSAATSSVPGSAIVGPSDGGRMGARTIYRPKPEELELPEALRHRTIEMVAVARFRVGADGSARVELVEPTSDPDLNRALIAWLRRFRFFPGMQDGKPIVSTVDIRVPISVR